MASFRCYDNSHVIATLIMTNFPLYLIQLWWQFFPNACLWRRSLCSNLAGIDSEKLYRATFICQYGLFCCMALVSFRLFCKNLGNLQEFFGQMDYRPPWQKIARTPMKRMYELRRLESVVSPLTIPLLDIFLPYLLACFVVGVVCHFCGFCEICGLLEDLYLSF